MAGGIPNNKHNHPSSLRVASRLLKRVFVPRDSLESAFSGLSADEISTCAESCPMFKNSRCEALGIKAPVGKDCEAQLISRRER